LFYTGKLYNHKIFIYIVHVYQKQIKSVYNCFIYNGHHSSFVEI